MHSAIVGLFYIVLGFTILWPFSFDNQKKKSLCDCETLLLRHRLRIGPNICHYLPILISYGFFFLSVCIFSIALSFFEKFSIALNDMKQPHTAKL